MKKSILLFFAAILCAIGASAATKTIYFKSQQWWHKDGAASAAYYWGTGGNANTWPGTRMTKVAGETNVWSIDIDTDKYQNIIFTRVNGSGTVQDWGAKTEDLVIPTDDKNFFTLSTTEAWDGNKATGTWSVYTPTVTHTFAKNSTLYVDFRAITDASKKGANYPKAGSVGIDYSANAGGTVIPVTFTADVKWAEGTEFIKTDKGGWASIPFKAPEAGQNCAQVAADGKSYTWTVYSEPSVTLSLDKTQADAGTNVTVTLTATADNVSGEVTYAFQYSTDNATWNNITATGNTATQTFAAETRYYKVTMTNGGTTKEATAKFSAIKFHIIGSWDSWAAHNEVVEGSKTITLEANKTYEYKITNGTWDLSWGNDGTMDRNNCTDWSFESNNNAKIKTDEAGDYVFNVSRNAEGKVKVSVVYPELSAPIPTFDYYIAGNMNGWDKAHVEYGMTDENADGIYEKEITLAAGQDHQFKVTNGKWGNEDGGFDCATVEGSYEEVDSKDGNVLVKLNTETTFTVKFNKNTEKITFEGLTETETETLVYTVEVPEGTEDCYIAGQMNDWEFERMTQVNATQWTITYDNVLKTTEYKYACQPSWDYKELDKEGNDIANRTWTELDKVEKWGKPVIVTYQLKGVGGWEQPGIELVQNPGNDKEYMLTCQAISATDAIKVVRLEDGVIKDYYGNGTVKDGVTVDVSYDGEANIKLPEGKYNFYFDTNEPDKKLWIAAATDCGLATITLTTGDNSAVIAANIGNTVNVKIERSFTANDGYYTLCVPFNMDPSVIGKAYYLGNDIKKHVSGEGIDIELVEETYMLSAGVPYLVLPKANMSELVVENVTIESDPASGQNITSSEELNVQIFFEGFYSASGQTNGSTEYYVGNNGYLYNEVVDKRGLCGLFTITDREGNPTKVRARVVTREDEATGLENITNGENTTIKLIENGQLIIIRGNEKFNAQGVRL